MQPPGMLLLEPCPPPSPQGWCSCGKNTTDPPPSKHLRFLSPGRSSDTINTWRLSRACPRCTAKSRKRTRASKLGFVISVKSNQDPMPPLASTRACSPIRLMSWQGRRQLSHWGPVVFFCEVKLEDNCFDSRVIAKVAALSLTRDSSPCGMRCCNRGSTSTRSGPCTQWHHSGTKTAHLGLSEAKAGVSQTGCTSGRQGIGKDYVGLHIYIYISK